eukprot:561970-Hanusia_phi.AAC.1
MERNIENPRGHDNGHAPKHGTSSKKARNAMKAVLDRLLSRVAMASVGIMAGASGIPGAVPFAIIDDVFFSIEFLYL